MARARLHSVRSALAAIVAIGAIIVMTTGPVAATEPWQTSWGDYDCHEQWHNAAWWLQNQPAWATTHHPEWTDNYANTYGQIGDYDGLHLWHYGDGALDRESAALVIDRSSEELAKDRQTSTDIDTLVTKNLTP